VPIRAIAPGASVDTAGLGAMTPLIQSKLLWAAAARSWRAASSAAIALPGDPNSHQHRREDH